MSERMAGGRVPVGGLLLAAGQGERFRAAGGDDKLTACLPNGRMVVLEALRRLQAALAPAGGAVVAVVRAERTDLAALLRAQGAEVVVSERAGQGMGASLADGLAGWPEDRGVIVALGDMPWVQSATLSAVVEALSAGVSVVRPRCQGQAGHPVGFGPQWLGGLLRLEGDQGARTLLAEHRQAVRWITADDDAGCLRDVDRPADLAGTSLSVK